MQEALRKRKPEDLSLSSKEFHCEEDKRTGSKLTQNGEHTPERSPEDGRTSTADWEMLIAEIFLSLRSKKFKTASELPSLIRRMCYGEISLSVYQTKLHELIPVAQRDTFNSCIRSVRIAHPEIAPWPSIHITSSAIAKGASVTLTAESSALPRSQRRLASYVHKSPALMKIYTDIIRANNHSSLPSPSPLSASSPKQFSAASPPSGSGSPPTPSSLSPFSPFSSASSSSSPSSSSLSSFFRTDAFPTEDFLLPVTTSYVTYRTDSPLSPPEGSTDEQPPRRHLATSPPILSDEASSPSSIADTSPPLASTISSSACCSSISLTSTSTRLPTSPPCNLTIPKQSRSLPSQSPKATVSPSSPSPSQAFSIKFLLNPT